MRRMDDVIADPFEGPLERFQWRVTASYYMCLYTMLQTTELRRLHEPTCDNLANCLDGCDNRDSRADDKKPFACAIYSFCPDPCCSNKVLSKPEDCWNNPDNPCSRENEPGSHRKCSIVLDRNTDFSDIVLNRWNVSCRCPNPGMEWSSLYGICVDIDECAVIEKNNCDRKVEACVNLQGTFRCVCKWGHIFNEQQKKCIPSAALELVMLESQHKEKLKEEQIRLWRRIARFIFRSPNSSAHIFSRHWLAFIICCFISFLRLTY
nr:unnamed protein product [Callosobruchus chinensis]